MKYAFWLLAFWLCYGQIEAQTTYSKEIEQQIKQFENSLSGRVIINGKPDNILDRMAYFKVKGLSIALTFEGQKDHPDAFAKSFIGYILSWFRWL